MTDFLLKIHSEKSTEFFEPDSVMPDNQLARKIQSKSIRGLGSEPPSGDIGGGVPYEPGDLREAKLL